jgi:regulator of RNase E activity RraA
LPRVRLKLDLIAYSSLEPALAAPVLTVMTRPGDNLMIHHAMAIAEPGDVIVVDAGGATGKFLGARRGRVSPEGVPGRQSVA